MEWFHRQLELARDTSLPVIFHNRNTDGDFERVVREKRDMFTKGIVHSFTGDVEEMKSLVGLGLHIGINGCALKTEEGLEMASQIPLNRQVRRASPRGALASFAVCPGHRLAAIPRV